MFTERMTPEHDGGCLSDTCCTSPAGSCCSHAMQTYAAAQAAVLRMLPDTGRAQSSMPIKLDMHGGAALLRPVHLELDAVQMACLVHAVHFQLQRRLGQGLQA